jgi:hypothetical protein
VSHRKRTHDLHDINRPIKSNHNPANQNWINMPAALDSDKHYEPLVPRSPKDAKMAFGLKGITGSPRFDFLD